MSPPAEERFERTADQVYQPPEDADRSAGLQAGARGTTEFGKALGRLANDVAYRDRAMKDPLVIARDFRLTLKDLQALRQVSAMSGADIRQVNRVRADAITAITTNTAADVDVSCCSCCCCCCGDTAVAPLVNA